MAALLTSTPEDGERDLLEILWIERELPLLDKGHERACCPLAPA
jgi:hypothetical protein